MKILIVYDSVYGNTEKIAKPIGCAIAGGVKTIHVREADFFLLESVDLLIIGSPTQGGRATLAIQNFLDGIPEPALRNMRVATFDTRLPTRLVGIFGYATDKIADILKVKGGTLVVPPEGFIVKGREGPLKEGEEQRAAEWAKVIIAACRGKS